MRLKELSGDGVQPADLKRIGKADAKVYVHKDGKTILVPASKKDEYMAKGYKLSALRAEDDNSSKGGKEGFDYPQGGKYGYKAERGSGTGAMGTMQVNVTIHNRETNEIMNIKDMHYLELEKGEEQETLAMIWDENKDLIQKEDAEDDRIKKAMKDMVPSTVTGYYEITEFWKEHTQGMGKTDDEVMHEIYEWTWDEMGVSDTKERDEVAKRTAVIVNDVIKNNKDDMTFDDMIEQLKGKKEDDNSSRGMNKYGLAARNKDGKFYSYRHGKLTGTFDNIKDLQKHQAELIKDESVDQDTDESGIMYRAGVKKYGKDGMRKIQSAAGKGASHQEIGKIKDKYVKDDMQEDEGDIGNEIAKMYDTAYEYINDSSDNPSDIESDYKFGYNDDDSMEAEDLAAAFRKDLKTGMALQKQLQAQREKEGREGDWDPFNPESMYHNELKALMSKVKGESVSENLAHMAHKVEQDHEVQMARSDLYKAAKYSISLHEMLKNVSEEQGIEGWVAAKITKAADYLSSVKHYMEYDMMESKTISEATACNCDENCSCGGNCTSGCNCKPGCETLDESWLDSLKQMGYRFRDELKSLNDPALAAKLQADDQADLRTNNMVNDLNTIHAMNRTPTDQGYDNETIVGYISKYVMPRHPSLHNQGDFLKKMFPPGQNTNKDLLRGQLQKIAQMSQKVDVGQQQPQTASMDYKQSMHKKFEAKLKETMKKPVLEDFIGKPISEEEFEKLAEKKDACYHKVRSRYKVWPSAYASGALVQCRKKGAANWGNKSKK